MNLQTTARLARRFDAAQTILRDGYTFDADPEMDAVRVFKPGVYAKCGGFAYLLDTGRGFTECDCADFQKHGDFCKHTLAWDLREDDRMNAALCGMDADTYRAWKEYEEAR